FYFLGLDIDVLFNYTFTDSVLAFHVEIAQVAPLPNIDTGIQILPIASRHLHARSFSEAISFHHVVNHATFKLLCCISLWPYFAAIFVSLLDCAVVIFGCIIKNMGHFEILI
ncbi:hypothetical protein ACJX0J_013640, partial [Zea mays]